MSTNSNGTVNANINDDNLEVESLGIVKKMFEQYPNMKQKIHHYDISRKSKKIIWQIIRKT